MVKKTDKKKFNIFFLLWGIITIILILFLVYFVFVEKRYEVYKIEFDSNGGSKVGSQLVVEGERILEPEAPEKEGYEFEYWVFDGKKYDFSRKVKSNLELKAKWSKYEEDYSNDIFYSSCYSYDMETETMGEQLNKVVEGDTIVCYVSFETYAEHLVEAIQFNLDFGDGLEFQSVVYDYDLESSSGLHYRYVYEDPMPVNEAGGYVFKVVDSRDVYLNFKDISYVVNDTIVDVSDFEVSLEAVANNTIEDGYVEYRDDATSLSCYDYELYKNDVLQEIATLKKGDKIACFVEFSTLSKDPVKTFSFRINAGDNFALMDSKKHENGDLIKNKYFTNFKTASSYARVNEFIFEVVEDVEDDELYVEIEEIRFTTKDGKQYFNKDILLEFDLK